MAYILDGVIILILVVTVALGYRRGFIRSIVQLVGLVAAVMVAFSLSSTLATVIYDSAIKEPLRETIVQVLEDNRGETATVQMDKVVESLPGFVAKAIDSNAEAKNALDQLQNRMQETASAVAETLVTGIVRPIAIGIFRFFLFLLLVGLLLVVVKILTKIIKPITKLPLIRQADGLLGAAVGLVKAVMFILIAITVMQLLAASGTLITHEQLDSSAVAGWLAENNPLSAKLEFI